MDVPRLEDLGNLDGRRVLVRCDFNVPLVGGAITDDLRIRAAVPTLRYLLDAGAQVATANPQEEQMQPIHHCGEWAAYTDQLDRLLERGADINAAAGNGWTALDYAMDRGRKGMVNSLKARGGRTSGRRDAS